MGQIPNFLSHQEFREVLKHGLTTAHRNITFAICDLCLTQCFGFFNHDAANTFPSPLSEKTMSHQHEFCLSCLGVDQDWLDP